MSGFNLRAEVRGQGRSLSQIADAFGTPLPSPIRAVAASSRHTEAALVRSSGTARGFAGRARGWSPVPHPLVVYRASTAEIGGVFPFVGAEALPPTGASVGVDAEASAGAGVDPDRRTGRGQSLGADEGKHPTDLGGRGTVDDQRVWHR